MNKIIILYVVFLSFISGVSYLFLDAGLSYFSFLYTSFSTDHRFISSFLYGVIIILFFSFYFLILKKLKKNPTKPLFWKILGIQCFILLFSYPAMLSHDVFNYVTTSKVLTHYHENPYVVMPIEFVNDPYLDFTRAANKYALYGPSWLLLTSIPYILGFQNFILTLFFFKVIVTMFYIGAVYLLWKLLKNIFFVGVFALNPLVVIESLISSHNDIVMMFFAMGSFYALEKRRFFLAGLLLVFSVLIKYATIVLVPIFIFCAIQLIRRQKIDWKNIFLWSWIAMIVIFLFSFLREEIYPWYAVWFLTFIPFLKNRRVIFWGSMILSFSLLTRYLPFMATGTYFGTTPIIKSILTVFPLVIGGIYFLFRKWSKS